MIWSWLAHPWPGYPLGNFFCLSCFLCDCIELLLSEDEATIRLSVSSWPAGNSCSGLGSMYSSMSMLKEGLRVMWGTSSISSSSVAWKIQSWGNFHKISVVYSWIVTMNWCVALQLDKECPITFLSHFLLDKETILLFKFFTSCLPHRQDLVWQSLL